MRIVGLFALTLFFPVFVHAANPPTLTTYTVSHTTIYPTATVGSGLATTTSIDTAFSEQVKVSIKIVSASGALMKSLYTSSSVTNPTSKTWDGTNTTDTRVADGTYTILISATSTASGLSMNDSSKTITVASQSSDSDSSSSDTSSFATTNTTETTTAASTGGGAPEYLPMPTLHLITSGTRTISSGADVAFTAAVYDSRGNKRDDAVVTWSFGDGMRKVGASVFHEYYDSGEYLAVVHATTSDGGNAQNEIVVTVKDANIKISSVSSRGIALMNNDSRTLDLSLWRLSMGGKEFKIPEDTEILAGHTVLFSSKVIELPIADSASLLYPSGEVAATYSAVAAAPSASAIQSTSGRQPSLGAVSYTKVSEVEPIPGASTNIQIHEEAVNAPSAVSIAKTAEGAVLLSESPTSSTSRTTGIFKSPWTLGFLATLVLASGAFIFL